VKLAPDIGDSVDCVQPTTTTPNNPTNNHASADLGTVCPLQSVTPGYLLLE
jgi:hypothetical protein